MSVVGEEFVGYNENITGHYIPLVIIYKYNGIYHIIIIIYCMKLFSIDNLKYDVYLYLSKNIDYESIL